MKKAISKLIKFLLFCVAAIAIAIAVAYLLTATFTLGGIRWDTSIFKSKTFFFIAIATSCILIGALIYFLIKYKFFNASKIISVNDRTKSNLYDSSDFMSHQEVLYEFGSYSIDDIKSLDISGFLINSEFDKKGKLRFSIVDESIDTHALLIGGSGTGKSTLLAIPMIQINAASRSKPSMIINDLAGELYKKNAQNLINKGYDVKVINLRFPEKTFTRYNPLSLIWDLYHAYIKDKSDISSKDRCAVEINELARIICPETHGSDKNWNNGARGIFIGCIYGMLEDSLIPEYNFTKTMFTIAQVSNIVNRQKPYLKNFLFDRPKTSKVFDYASIIYGNESEKTVDSYISHLQSSLTLFLEEGMQYITSATDMELSSISQRPTAIFIIVPNEYPSRYIIGTMIILQIYNYLAFESSLKIDNRLERPIYYFLDEFGNLPKIENFQKIISTSRKMRIYFYLMLQSNHQLEEVYGKEQAQTIINNCGLQCYLGSTDDNTIDFFQKKFGTYTALSLSQQLNTKNLEVIDFVGNKNLTKKDLVTKSELQKIPKGTMYSFLLRHNPIKSNLIPSYNNRAALSFDTAPLKEELSLGYAYNNRIYDLEARNALLEQPPDQGPEDINESELDNTAHLEQKTNVSKIDFLKY